MKRSTKKLGLSRETLRRLRSEDLTKAKGGADLSNLVALCASAAGCDTMNSCRCTAV